MTLLASRTEMLSTPLTTLLSKWLLLARLIFVTAAAVPTTLASMPMMVSATCQSTVLLGTMRIAAAQVLQLTIRTMSEDARTCMCVSLACTHLPLHIQTTLEEGVLRLVQVRRQASQARVWDKVGRAFVGQGGTTGLLKAAH